MIIHELRDENWIAEYEKSLTLTQWQEWLRFKQIEREFAKNSGYDFGYDRYWETMTLPELQAVNHG